MSSDSAVLSSNALRHARPKSVTTTRVLVFRARRLHEHDVVALEVAVHHSDTVRGRQAGDHLTDDRQDLRGREPSIPLELVGQRLAVQQLHREKHDLVGRVVGSRGSGPMPEDIVDAADVRVRHLSRQVHLALEPDDRALVGRNVRQDGFERDPLAQLEILGLVELAHPAFRQEADDAETEGDDLASPKDGLTGRPGLARLGARGSVGVGRLCRGRRTRLGLPTEQPLDGEMGIDARDHLFRLRPASR